MAKQSDINLVLRAKNEASKGVSEVTTALKALEQAQQDAAKGADKAQSSLSGLGDGMAKLSQEVKSLSTLDKVASQLGMAAEAITRLSQSVADSENNIGKLQTEYTAATSAIEQYAKKLKDASLAEKAQETALANAQKELSEINKAVRKADSAYNRLAESIKKATAPTAEMVASQQLQKESLDKMVASQASLAAKRDAEKKNLTELKNATSQYAVALNAAERNQSRLSEKLGNANAALVTEKETLQTLKAELSAVSQSAQAAAKGLGAVELNAESIAAAAQKAQLQLKALESAQARLQSSQTVSIKSVASTSPLGQLRNLIQLKKAQKEAAEEATRLGKALAQAGEPSKELASSFEIARVNAQAAKNEYLSYVTAVRTVAGTHTATAKSGLQLAQSNFVAAQSAQAAAKAQAAEAAEMAKVDAIQKKLATSTSAYAQIMRFLSSATAQTAEGQAKQYNVTRTSLSLFQRLRGQVLGLTAAYIGFFQAVSQIQSVITVMESVASAQAKLSVAFGNDATTIASEMDFLRSTAVRLGQDFAVLTEQYSNFATASMGANYGAESTRKIFIAVSETARVLNLSTQAVELSFKALNQMITKGSIQAEELKGQLGDSMTGAFQLFAMALGKTTGELDKMLRQGGMVYADRANLEKFANTLTDKFGGALPMALGATTTEMQKFHASITVLKDTFAKGGFDKALGEFFRKLNTFTGSKEGEEFFTKMGAAAGHLIDALSYLADNLEYVSAAIKVVVAVKFATYLTSLTSSTSTLARAWVTLRTAISATNAVLKSDTIPAMNRVSMAAGAFVKSLGAAALLNGVVSVAIMAVLNFATKWLSTSLELNDSLDKHVSIMEKVQQAYSEQARGLSDWKKSLESVSVIDIKLNTESLQKDLANLRASVRKQMSAVTARESIDRNGMGPNQLYRDLNSLAEAYAKGTINVTQFKNALDQLKSSLSFATSGVSVEDLTAILDSVSAIEDRVKALRANELAQKALTGTLTDAEKSELNLASAVSDVNEQLLKKEAQENYLKIMNELKSAIPDLVDEVKKLGELKAIDDLVASLEQMKNNARISGEEFAAAIMKAEEAKRAISEKYDTKAMAVGKTYADKVALAESGGRSTAANPNSSALGLGQFIESTWLELFKRYFPSVAAQKSEAEILALRTDAEASRQLIEAYAAENSRILQEAGVSVDDAARYLAHFLGPAGAVKLLKADKNTPVSNILSPSQINSNASVLQGKNAEEVVAWARQKMQITEQELGIVKLIDDAEQKRLDAQKESTQYLDETISSKELELQQTQKTTRAITVQKAEQDALNRLNKQRNQLSADEAAKIAKIGELAGQVYDIEQGRANIDNEVNRLLSDRQELMSQMTLANEQGDIQGQQQLAAQIEDVNVKMREAIDTAVKMWKAIGGNEAESAVLKLEGLKRGLKDVKQQSEITGQSINNLITDGLVSKFNTFLDAVFAGKNVFASLRDAFLQFAADFLREIANMILKQMIFSALGGSSNSSGVGASIASAIAGQFHTGGVVGAGGVSRAVSPSWFHNAVRYHTGGVAGLKPNEVPAVLQKGEEVLTSTDPRHINNGGGSTPMNVKVVNAIDPADFISAGLNSPVGERALLNYIRSNQGAVRAAMGA